MSYIANRHTFLRALIILLAFLVRGQLLHAQEASQHSQTNNPPNLVLMCLAAHPDDEDGGTMAYYSKLHDVKTYSIFFTRGEGGQNEIGSELYEDLGNIRTKETLEAAKILGTEPYFLGFPDFGFSKTAKETFAKWGGKDSVLAKLVYYIRALKPDIIITNHDTVTTRPNRQHGNHQAVGIAAYEAFEKAADPTFHPEQLKGNVTPWQVKKLLFRITRLDSSAKHDSLVMIDATQRDSSGIPIEEYAIQSLRKHRSQGMEFLTLTTVSEWFHHRRYILVRSDIQYPFSPSDLFSGIVSSSKRIVTPFVAPLSANEELKLEVSPSVVPFELTSEANHQKIHRKFWISLLKRTPSPLEVSLKVSMSGMMLFSKLFYLKNDQLSDTISIVLRKGKNLSAQTLKFETTPAEENQIGSASTTVTMKPTSASYEGKPVIGLVKTYDNTLEEVFTSFHINYRLLDSASLASEKLSKYTTIVLDLRTYEFRTDARMYNSRLLDYVKNGGNIVCFYHKSFDWNGKEYAPYSITLTSERVTQEDAPVKILLPEHFLLNSPNKLSSEDWNGWMQERSIYLPSDDTTKTSSKYERLLAMSDEDEQQPPTSLLWCKYGKGTYAYVSLVLYRQLRMLNDGAVKLFFNLISQPKH